MTQRGKPDIILVNNNNFLNIAVSQGPMTTSDHVPIIVHLAICPIKLPSTPRFEFNKAGWESFRRDLSEIELINIDKSNCDKIDDEMDKWFSIVIDAMEKNIPKSNFRTIPFPKI